jgi:D-alanyl-D-alanine carboxypeptidase
MRSGAVREDVRRPRSQAHRRRSSGARSGGAPVFWGLGLALAAIVLIGPVGGLAGGPGAARPGGTDRPTAGRLVPATSPGTASGPASPVASGPAGSADLPACRFDDVPATPRPAGDWTLAILDTIYRLPAGYAPPDLVPVANAGISGGGQVRATMVPDLRALAKAAAKAGLPLAVKSAYRNEARQKAVYDDWVRTSGETAARQFSARPGHSEHQLGLAVDFAAEGGTAPWDESFEQTAQGHWLAEHAAAYGFVMSYPRGAEAVTCYAYEPWHFRWVGRTVARAVAASRKPLREWLWSGQDATP